MSREAVAAALFDKLKSAANFGVASRILRHWSDVSPADMPALFLTQGSQQAQAGGNQPTIWRYQFTVYVYTHSEDPAVPPSTQLNDLLDALEASLIAGEGPLTGRQQLGLPNVVENCRFDGTIETDEGVLGQTAVAILPITVLARR
jgi:hypothetical protein